MTTPAKLYLVLLLTFSWMAQATEVGTQLTQRTLPDQHDENATLDGQTRLLLVASSRDAAELVDNAIKEQPEGYLEARDALYVADVSQMPSFITKWVLKPSMRSANYRILLDYESQVAPEHLGTGDDVLWLELDDLEVRNRQTFSSSDALREALEQQPQ